MALNERDRRAVTLGGAGIGLIVLYMLVIEPMASGYASLVSQHEDLTGQVARAVYTQKKNTHFARQVAEYEGKSGPLLPAKPYGEQMTSVGEQIVAAAGPAQAPDSVKIKGSTPAAPIAWAEDPSLEMALIRIDAEADWEKLFEFIANVYRIPGVLSVEQMELTGDPKKGGKIAVRLSVSVLAKADKQQDSWTK
jgi:hypothetical protein